MVPQTRRGETAGQDTSRQGNVTVKRPWTRWLQGDTAASKVVEKQQTQKRPKAATRLGSHEIVAIDNVM